ncbi:outer membrane autotransporter protein [Bartonella callosciuri]|uniref:Outer membrane autotransporter protein n=1 Tax=Bartonella callosciuri TaxID=686223 RepID=A0A840NVI6_9HYPH|nr:autotransporter outer membrane beta-barrel domain-containing protein [Bartonella callosciuri]MBB5073943.1 outer membrane autotransporter protein [Bartonella callosciuri]
MVKIFKNYFSLCAFTTAILLFTHNADAKVQAESSTVQTNRVSGDAKNSKDFCNEDTTFYRCNDGKTYEILNKTYQKTHGESAEEVAIEVSGEGTGFKGENIIIRDASSADKLEKSFWKYSIIANNSGRVEIEKGAIDLTNGSGVQTGKEGMVYLTGVSITEKGSHKTDVDRHNKNSVFHMFENGGYIKFKEGKVKVANAHGVSFHGDASYIDILDSTVMVEGNASYGFRFVEEQKSENKKKANSYVKERLYTFWGESTLFEGLPRENLPKRGSVNLYNTVLMVPNSTAIYSRKSGSLIKLLENSKISGDLLLKADDGSYMKVSADSSIFVGGARVDESSTVELRLRDGSKWTLSRPKNENLRNSGSIGDSSISLIHITDSSLLFEKPQFSAAGNYQILRIGKGIGEVYKAQGKVHLYLNTYLNQGGALQDQKTDRLLIYGDIEGKTTVHVQSVPGSPGGSTGQGGNREGISIIQVSGEASEDSFQLEGGYVALESLPYQYRLYAYGPGSHLGKADSSQRLVAGNGDFWDFRLENRYMKPSLQPAIKPSSDQRLVPGNSDFGDFRLENKYIKANFEERVKDVVPQVPIYLLLPNALFHARLMDISNQNKQLEIQRTISTGMLEVHENHALFLRGYGGNYHYTSDLSALEYGYGGNLTYNAVEASALLHTIENPGITVSFGVMGSYGKFSLQPLDVEQSKKSAFDKWSITAYGSMQHGAGFYVDGLVSYGLFKGDVLTLLRGKTATLKGNPFSVSLAAGKAFVIGHKDLVFDPQVQVIYQNLQFDKAFDIDGFDIDMGKLDQLLMCVGGRLIKTLTTSQTEGVISFNGRLHFTHGLKEAQSVHFKDTFKLGAFGSSLEAGFGFNARLSSKFSLKGDLVYQHKLSKAGFSGISFSGGMRYRF